MFLVQVHVPLGSISVPPWISYRLLHDLHWSKQHHMFGFCEYRNITCLKPWQMNNVIGLWVPCKLQHALGLLDVYAQHQYSALAPDLCTCLLQPFMNPVKNPTFWNCSLLVDGWEEFLELYSKGDFKFTSGGLGPSRVHHIYLTWVCLLGKIPWPSRYVFVHPRLL